MKDNIDGILISLTLTQVAMQTIIVIEVKQVRNTLEEINLILIHLLIPLKLVCGKMDNSKLGLVIQLV